MAKTNPSSLVTKAYLNDAVDHILCVMGQLLQEFKQDMVNHFQKLEAGQTDLTRQVNDLKMDSPTQAEFTTLTKRVNHLERFRTPN